MKKVTLTSDDETILFHIGSQRLPMRVWSNGEMTAIQDASRFGGWETVQQARLFTQTYSRWLIYRY